MIQFQHIEYLIALVAIIPMWMLYEMVIRWKKNRINKIGDAFLVNQLIKDYSAQKFKLKFILFITAFAFTIIGLSNPRMKDGNATVKRSGIDVMIALDVSKSMLATDIKPNRITRAKQFVSKLIDKLEDDRIGIVVFAGRAYLQMPLTTDHVAAKMYLNTASSDVVPTQGTVIADALKMCYASFNTTEKKYKSIILISDGEDHDENAIKITKALAGEGVMVNTVGIGSATGATIPDENNSGYKKDEAGNAVISKLNEAALKEIATNGNGIYQLYSTPDELSEAISVQLKKMGQRSITESSMMSYQVFFQWFLAAALFLLIVELIVSEKKINRSLKKPIAALPFFMLINFLPLQSFSQKETSLIKEGNDAFIAKKYALAAENYRNAVTKNPSNAIAQYNLGNALYQDKNTEEALLAYDAAIGKTESPAIKSNAWYNKGLLLQEKNKLAESIEAYKNAIRINPQDEDARLNLQKALQKQKQQQKKEEPKKQDNQKQKPKDDKENQPKPSPPKMTKKEAEEKLKALLQQEKNLQDKLRKVDVASPQKSEKDW